MRVDFVGQSARDADNQTGNHSRLVNGCREPMISGGRAGYVLRAVPGMQEFAATGNIFARDMMTFDGALMVIMGRYLYKITAAGAVALIGDVEATDTVANLSQSAGYVTASAGRKFWHWNGTTLATVATGAVTNVGSVAYLGGYALVSGYGARIFNWSALANPTTWSGLDFASAEGTPDPIIRMVAFKDALYIFKNAGFERWVVTGSAGPDAFQRIGGAQEEPGLAAFGLVATFPNGMAFVGSDGRVYLIGAGPISTPAVEVAIERFGPQRMFYYAQRGHGFICIAFASGPAWCYDVATGEWHEREEDEGPWTARASSLMGGLWYVATEAGKVARLSSTCADFGAPLVRRYVSKTLEMGQRFSMASLEAFPRIQGDVQGLGDDTEAKVSLRTSRDGVEWSAAKDRGVGSVGAYQTRLVWRGLGQFRQATIELSQSSAVDVPLLASIDVVTA